MNSDLKTVVIAVMLAGTGCTLPVSPPDDWPPAEDTTPPSAPLDDYVTVSVSVDASYRRAVTVRWLPVPDKDVLMYRVTRSLPAAGGSGETVSLYRTAAYRSLDDPGPLFPSETGVINRYEYAVEAVDSAGNVSDASDSHFVALAVPPVLIAPLGTTGSGMPQFSWEGRYDDGKDYTLYLADAAGDTLLDVRVGIVYERSSAYGYDDLRTAGGADAPLRLTDGTYRWWVRMVLVDATGQPENRTGLAVGTFTVR